MNQTHIFNLLLIFSQRHIEGGIIYYSELTQVKRVLLTLYLKLLLSNRKTPVLNLETLLLGVKSSFLYLKSSFLNTQPFLFCCHKSRHEVIPLLRFTSTNGSFCALSA